MVAVRPHDFHHRWASLLPPLRPPPSAVDAMAMLLADVAGPTILLGVTPELAAIDREMTALDWSADMIALAWGGDTARRKAICCDWKSMPFADATIGAAFSDGALTMLDWPDEHHKVIGELARVVRSGGRVAIRCFAPSGDAESVDSVIRTARAGSLGFHEFKLRFNIAVAAENGRHNVTTRTLFDRFEHCFPDRTELADLTDWPLSTIDEMDAYRVSSHSLCYPSRGALTAMIENRWPGSGHFVETHGYPGAGQCPILVLDRA